MNHKKIQLTALLLAFLCLLGGCKGGDDGGGDASAEGGGELPTEYSVGEENVAALTPGEGAEMSMSGTISYTYEGLESAASTVAGYVAQLKSEESGGFTVVDEELAEAEEPPFTTLDGTVRLAKNAAEPGKAITVLITWVQGSCTVTLDEVEGSVTTAPEVMTMTEAVDFLMSKPPASLGLDGSSMEDYRVCALDGAVLVDGEPCMRIYVYSADNPQQTNELEGSYLMSGDGRHLYRLHEETDTVEELDA